MDSTERNYTDAEIEIADRCVDLAETFLGTHTPDIADRFGSSREASGAFMSITTRQLSGEIPDSTARIAAGLAAQAHDERWPDWRDELPDLPVGRTCPACSLEMPLTFRNTWSWCPACGHALAG